MLRKRPAREKGKVSQSSNSITSPPAIAELELTAQALKLRKLGYEYEVIGQKLGITLGRASQLVAEAVNKFCEECVEDAEIVKEMELARLDKMLSTLMPMFEAGNPVHPNYYHTVLAIQERRSKLMGLDAAKKMEHSGEIGVREIVGIDADKI